MSNWSTVSFSFSPLDGLRPPMKAALRVLKTVEAVLEALMDLVKPFLLDLGNPIRALISLLLASVRAIINQLRAGGIAALLVHPDFSRQDFGSVLESASGGYRAFESKVVAKFHDQSDVNRPAYPPGSSAAMVVFYIGAESPGDLMRQLFALLSLVKHPAATFALPAPVELKASPVFKSDSAIAQGKEVGLKVARLFSDRFSNDLDKKLVLEWRMPSAPGSTSAPSFVNHLVSFSLAYRFPNFMIERSESPNGTPVRLRMQSSTTADGVLQPKIGQYSMPAADTLVDLREQDGRSYKHFDTKIQVKKELGLLEGQATGTYRYVDDDPNLEQGRTYYYRVRAFFGKPTEYAAAAVGSFNRGNKELVRREGNKYFVNFGKGVTMGPASAVAKGFVPRNRTALATDFNPQSDLQDAVKAALLLNFELPAASVGDSPDEQVQKTGWGTLSIAAANVGAMKSAYKDSESLKDSAPFKLAARRVANTVAAGINEKTQMASMLADRWRDGVSGTVHDVLKAPFKWSFVGVVGGYGPRQAAKVKAYLAKEDSYNGQFNYPADPPEGKGVLEPSDGTGSLDGPYPVRPMSYRDDEVQVSQERRQQLADFLRLALASRSQSTAYMSWYSVTLGDIFPALIPFVFDFEQFVLSLMKALDSILKEIEAIVQSVLDKIRQLEQILETILNLIDVMNVGVSVSVLGFSGTNSSASDLANALLQSGDKPGEKPWGFHSGMVLTAGGPGEGSVQALKALGFILGFDVK